MPAGQAIDILRRFQQQLPGFPGQSVGGLDAAGIGAVSPKKFFSTPYDEQFLRDQLFQSVLGRYGQQLPNPTGGFDPFTGSYRGIPDRIDIPGPGGGYTAGPQDIISRPISSGPSYDPISGGDIVRPGPSQPQYSGAADFITRYIDQIRGQTPIGQPIPVSPGTQSQLPVGAQATGIQQIQGPGGSLPGITFQAPIEQVTNPGQSGLMQNPVTGQFEFAPIGSSLGGLPGLDRGTRNALDAIQRTQLDTLNQDYGQQQQALLNDLFSRGIEQSSIAGDVGGRLLSGRAQALNQITGQTAERELGIRQQLLAAEMEKARSRGTIGGSFGGGFGGGGGLSGIARDTSSLDPLTFEQKLALRQLGLQEGELGLAGRELDLRGELGRGELGLGQKGQEQALLEFLLGQGLSRQQSAAGLRQQDLGQLRDYTLGQQQIGAGLTQSQAQIEAQRRSLLSQLLGFGASLGGSILTGGLAPGGIFR